MLAWAAEDILHIFKLLSEINGRPEFTCNAKIKQRSKSVPQRLNNTPRINCSQGVITIQIGSHPKIEVGNNKVEQATAKEKLDT